MATQPEGLKTQIEVVSLERVQVCGFNPEARVSKTALSSLKKSIQQYGMVMPIDVLLHKGKYVVANGHRRFEIAKELGWAEIRVAVHDWPFERLAELWKLFSTAKGISAQNWAESWFRCNGKMQLPSSVKSNLENMIRIFGKARARELVVENRISPNVVHCLRQVVVRLVEVPSAGTFTESEVGEWLIRHRMQNNVNALFSGGLRPPVGAMRKLATCIRRNEPYDVFDRTASKAAA